jgi:mRNA interferase MazF
MMIYRRGDVLLGKFPRADGTGAKRRPVLVVQSDTYNPTFHNTVVAQITSNLRRGNDAAHFLIEANTPEGRHSGLLVDSLVSCVNLATLHESLIDQKIGELPSHVMQRIDTCLKIALGIP